MSVYAPDDARPPARLPWFLGGVGSWFGAFGMQGVLFSSLLVVELGENEVRVGAAQSAMMVPSVLLILLGGAVADRTDRRRLLMALHGTLDMAAQRAGVKLREAAPASIKKHVTGNGRADKAAVFAAVKRLKYDPDTYDEADACALLDLAIAKQSRAARIFELT